METEVRDAMRMGGQMSGAVANDTDEYSSELLTDEKMSILE
jgi:hypothetical protein